MLFERVKTMTNLSNDVNRIEFSAEAVFYFVKELQDYNIQESRNDTIGDVFETFTEKSLKGELGQFFTPRNVVEMMVKMVDIKSTDIMIKTHFVVLEVFSRLHFAYQKRFSRTDSKYKGHR